MERFRILEKKKAKFQVEKLKLLDVVLAISFWHSEEKVLVPQNGKSSRLPLQVMIWNDVVVFLQTPINSNRYVVFWTGNEFLNVTQFQDDSASLCSHLLFDGFSR